MYSRVLIPSLCAVSLFAQTPPPAATAPAPTPAVTPDPTKPASVSGKIVSNTGQALKKATLTLRPTMTPSSGQAMPNPYSTTSDPEGTYTFEAVDPGTYMLSASRPGFQIQNYGSRKGMNGGTVLTLKSGQVMSAINITLVPQIVISGKVLDSDGDPVARTQVRVLRNSYFNGGWRLMPMNFAQTDDNGEYKFQSLGAGKYYVSAYPLRDQYFGQGSRSASLPPAPGQPAKQEEASIVTYYPSVTDSSAATPIELTQGHDRPGVDITLRKSAVFHARGKVAGQVPADRSQLRVMIMPRSSTYFDNSLGTSSPIGKDGTFDVSPIGPGSYNLSLVSQMGIFKSLALIPIDIATRDTNDLTITVENPVDLPGQITAEKAAGAVDDPSKPNTAPLHVRVSLLTMDSPLMGNLTATSAEDGAFTLTGVAAGRYRVFVSSSPDGTYLKSIRFADQDVLANNLTLQPGAAGTTRLEILLGAKAAKVEGTVQDADGKPTPATTVTLIPDPPIPERTDLYRQSLTDQTGHFSMQRIAPGKYRIYAWEELEQGNQYDPDFLKNFETKGTKLEIPESGSPQLTLTWIKQ